MSKKDPEKELKEEKDRFEAQNQEAYDYEVSGERFLKERAEDGQREFDLKDTDITNVDPQKKALDELRKKTFTVMESGILKENLTAIGGAPGRFAGQILETGANILDIFVDQDEEGNLNISKPRFKDILTGVSNVIDGNGRLLPTESAAQKLLAPKSKDASLANVFGTPLGPDAKNFLNSISRVLQGVDSMIDPALVKKYRKRKKPIDPNKQKELFTTKQLDEINPIPQGMKRSAYRKLASLNLLNEWNRLSATQNMSEFSRGVVSAITNPNFTNTDFLKARDEALLEFSRIFNQLDQKKIGLEMDHATPLKVTASILFPGSSFREIRQYLDILYRQGLYAGDDPLNLRLLPKEVHQVASNFVTDEMGRQGEKFFASIQDRQDLPKDSLGFYTHEAKLKIANLYAAELRRLNKSVGEAYNQFNTLYNLNEASYDDGMNADKLVNTLEALDLTKPVTIKSVKDIASQVSGDVNYEYTTKDFADITDSMLDLNKRMVKLERRIINEKDLIKQKGLERQFDKLEEEMNELDKTFQSMRGER